MNGHLKSKTRPKWFFFVKFDFMWTVKILWQSNLYHSCTTGSSIYLVGHVGLLTKLPTTLYFSLHSAWESVCVCVSLTNLVYIFGLVYYLSIQNINCYQTWVIDSPWECSYINEVRGHIPRSKVLWSADIKLVSYVKFIKFFDKLVNGLSGVP